VGIATQSARGRDLEQSFACPAIGGGGDRQGKSSQGQLKLRREETASRAAEPLRAPAIAKAAFSATATALRQRATPLA